MDVQYVREVLNEIKEFYPRANFEDYSDEKYDCIHSLVCLENALIKPHRVCSNCIYKYREDYGKSYVNSCMRVTVEGLK